ncbi:hypothetical protein C3B58_19740 [Lactonifactor longoviformis]|uniref:DUF5105 domain-containing protein n=1 Tax=Lactonifactor longoviformis DSM 17459 TaxID=1122155 RepID=A0A1M4ZPD4_9CLOT|nr:hypothetical protein [Lactonifactor longoviformis]POP30740.1 hypothetical protein C3B58_19740 [Lactonifactor longoviformis]SHF19864.1 hypothetical protein SAMN02745158_02844 [Lactonifactor longoviformis DSM 17459]
MKKAAGRGILTIVILSLCMTACGGKGGAAKAGTPADAVETALEAVKELDFKTCNQYTDNYVKTYKNWLGIPTEREYRIFNELQQPGMKRGSKFKANKRFAEEVVRNLSWNLGEVRRQGDKAEIDLEITNTDMTDVMGNYTIHIMEDMIKVDGTGLRQLVRSLSEIDYDKGRVLTYLEQAEGTRTEAVTAALYQKDGEWKLHLDEPLIRAVMGNLNAETYSEEVEERLEHLEAEYERKMEQWGEEILFPHK